MKIKNKGKVYPSPSSSSSSSSASAVASCSATGENGCLSVLKLLPAAILVLASVLSVEDREVLAYLITRSLKTTTTTTYAGGVSASSRSSGVHDSKKKKNNKSSKKRAAVHKPPLFDCDCFDCYTSYWLRWDSSPSRELIHQVIEAFEDHLSSGEATASQRPKGNNGRGKKKEKSGRRVGDNKGRPSGPGESVAEPSEPREPEAGVVSEEGSSERQVSPENMHGRLEAEVGAHEVAELEESSAGGAAEMVVRMAAETGHKGLARKVLPDLLGLFNSRLWSLWNPNA